MESRKTHSKHEKWSETEKTHTFFLKIGEDSEQSQKFEGKTENVLKTVFKTQNMRFSRLKQVASKSLGSHAKTLQA